MESEVISSCNLCGTDPVATIDAEHHLCQCTECGFIFDSPRPTFAEIQRFYSEEDQYDAWLAQEASRDTLWRRRLKRVLKYRQAGDLLDVGTGIGQFLSHAQRHFRVEGTEVSDNAISIAKSRYGFDIHQGQIEEIQFDKQFDVVTAFHVLEHVPAPSAFIARCRDLLKPGGILIIAIPNEIHSKVRQGVRAVLKVAGIGKFKNYGKHTLPKISLEGTLTEIHLSHFTQKTAAYLMKSQSLEIVDMALDPYYVSGGIGAVVHKVIYATARLFHMVFRHNLYDTMWLALQKPSVADSQKPG